MFFLLVWDLVGWVLYWDVNFYFFEKGYVYVILDEILNVMYMEVVWKGIIG